MKNTYPYLPKDRIIEYVSNGNQFIQEARHMAEEYSSDSFHHTGAVIVLKDQIIGRGANQSILKYKILQDFHKKYLCVRRIFNIKSGERYWLCPGCSSCKEHAESRAIRDALSRNRSIAGADLYLYGHWWCCKPCWDSMIGAGINNVYLVENADRLFKK